MMMVPLGIIKKRVRMKKKELLERIILLLDENKQLSKIVHELSSSVDFYRLQSERNAVENELLMAENEGLKSLQDEKEKSV